MLLSGQSGGDLAFDVIPLCFLRIRSFNVIKEIYQAPIPTMNVLSKVHFMAHST